VAEITYRAATVDDAAVLATLRWHMEAERHDDALPLEEYTAAYEAGTRAELARGTHRAWLAEADGRPAACVLLIWWVLPPNFENPDRKRGFVSSVYTLPEYRRQGIARRLMEMLVEHARKEGLQRLILWSSDLGRPLYESLGFVPSRGMELNL
jgi:ribosomal protein S18 acetylase RimI-like enzyme